MDKGEEYRQLAAECVRMAASANDAGLRGQLIQMATSWLKLADQAEKNSHADLVYETPPAPPDRPVMVQQQQQIQPKKDDQTK